MTGLLDRLRSWLGSLFGGSDSGAAADDEAEAEAAITHKCTVCGTGVEAGGTECPLCGSTDLRAMDGDGDGGGGEGGDGDGDEGGDRADGPPGARTVRTEDEDDDAVARLRELREEDGEGQSTGEE